jgi:hypothetical protein
MKSTDKQEWAKAYDSEYLGFVERKVFDVVKPKPGVKIYDTHKVQIQGGQRYIKWKTRMRIRGESGDQQISGVGFQESDLYAT